MLLVLPLEHFDHLIFKFNSKVFNTVLISLISPLKKNSTYYQDFIIAGIKTSEMALGVVFAGVDMWYKFGSF